MSLDVHPEFAASGSFAHLPLGRKPSPKDPRTLALARYLDLAAALPAVPPTADWTTGVPSWPMFGNDRLGDCLLPGSEVVAPDLQRAYRVFYDGPAVEIRTESGKKLAVTRNHAVLTARGFVRAGDLCEGDYLVSSDFPEAVAMRIDDDLDHVPSRVEKIFEANRRVGAPVEVESIEMYDAVDFHGDARFFEGEIDVVDADGFLDDRDQAAPREVEREFGLSLSPEAREPLHGRGPALAHDREIPRSASLLLRGLDAASALLGRHTAIAEESDLAPRPNLYASPTKPGSEELPADAELPSELLDRFAGLVTTDRVVEVRHVTFRGHVYDLSTLRRWYIADGIVTHNCTAASVGHMIQTWSEAAGSLKTFDEAAIEALYWATGSADDGRSEIDVLNYWRQNGVGAATYADRIVAYAAVNPANLDEVKAAIYLFGGIYAGIALPLTAQKQAVWDVVADTPERTRSGSWGGHAVPYVAYEADGSFLVVTWGGVLRLTGAFHAVYTDELYAIVSPDFLNAVGATPAGFDLERLQADLAEITNS